MLYLSRILPGDKIGVVDTDDGVETIVTEDELYLAVVAYHLDIAGVDDSGEYVPYQDMRYCSVKQTKLKAVRGVDIRTFKGEITYIGVGSEDVTIRLSDYGSKLLTSMAWNIGTGVLTIILDDSVEVVGKTLPCGFDGFCWDIREVTNDSVVSEVYSELIGDTIEDMGRWSNYVIDSQDRMDMWRLLAMLTTTDNNMLDEVEGFLEGKDLAKLSSFVVEQFMPGFERLDSFVLEMQKPYIPSNMVKTVASRLPKTWSIREKCRDYKVACDRALELFDINIIVDEAEYVTPRRLLNCCKLLIVPEKVQQFCLSYYHKFCKVVIEFCEAFGIEC